jgi:hypothetical protein
MPTQKKSKQKINPSREDLINLLDSELVKIEMEFTQKILNKFEEIIDNYPLSTEECVNLLRMNRKALGSVRSQDFYVAIIDGVFDLAEGQYENDIDNGDDCGFYFPLTTVMDKYTNDTYE